MPALRYIEYSCISNALFKKRQSRKRQKDPSIATTCSKKHKLESWTSGLESLIKDFSRLTLN